MLPQGYVLNRDKNKAKEDSEDDDDKLTLEEQIEEERANLKSEGLIPVTKESFEEWKR